MLFQWDFHACEVKYWGQPQKHPQHSKMPSKIKTILVWIAQIFVGLLFILVSLPKLQADPGWVERFHEWGFPATKQMVVVTGMLELAGGLGLLIPRTARYGGILLCLVMVGAFSTHLLNGEWPRLLINALLGGIILFVIMSRRNHVIDAGLSGTPSTEASE